MPDNRIRRIEPSDVDDVVRLVYELAEHESSLDQCHLTAGQLHASLFGERPALFGHVAEADGVVAGMALWFLNYSTWDGVHGIYLEDLYVSPAQRGSGLGQALLAALAAECLANGYTRLQWSVLTSLESTIAFYRSIGATHTPEWLGFRLTGDALAALGKRSQLPLS